MKKIWAKKFVKLNANFNAKIDKGFYERLYTRTFFTPTPNLWVQEPLSRKSVGAAAPTTPHWLQSL